MRTGRALAADVICILVFAIVGRSSHAETTTLLGVLHTAWPFLAGAAVGTLVATRLRGSARDSYAVPAGLLVWAGALVLGMVLRAVTGAGVAWSFVLVAAVVLALLLLGWRGVLRLVARVRGRRARTA